ncbi:hypothetical protein ACGFZJ_03805 [Streptomyces sp. NPDC048253]|uniref:hypothetical protein n=1 Tax=Streptomyces sp. NPDC048253 TaxID=3365524 RepID=UPI0037158DD1
MGGGSSPSMVGEEPGRLTAQPLSRVNFAGEFAPDTWRRFVALLIQSFQAPARGPLPDPPEDDALYQAMRRAGPAGPSTQERPGGD